VTVVDLDPTAQRAPGASSRPWAKERILETADRLFTDEGIHVVGVDRLISESGVTKATFYKHYGAKDTLIFEYISARHEKTKDTLEHLVASADGPEAAIRALVVDIVSELQREGFRGCAFINAATEYRDPKHPVRVVVAEHRDWYTSVLFDLLKQLGHPLPGDAADDFILARDGAMTGGYAGDSIAVGAALERAIDRVISDAKR
jgi:AcrR family transcriptional regulator